MLFLINGAQFLLTKISVDLGDGHSLMNWPMRACSAKDRATWIEVSNGREISWISSSLLTNLAASLFFFYGKQAKSRLKASADEGGGGGLPRAIPAPPWGQTLAYGPPPSSKRATQCTAQAQMCVGTKGVEEKGRGPRAAGL